MFTLDNYVGPYKDSPDWTPECQANAQALIEACTGLQADLEAAGIHFHLNPATGTTVSGEGHGGFRDQSCPIGAKDSAHKQGQAVDRYDPENEIDEYLWKNFNADPENNLLVKHGIYIEAPQSTPHWSHWGIRKPASGHHIFNP